MGATGNAFDLSPFEAAVQHDADVLGVLYTGSLGHGTADRYSDLDIECWVTHRAYEDSVAVIGRLMGSLGTVHFIYDRWKGVSMTGFVGPDWQRAEIALRREDEVVQEAKYATARIVKDVDGRLAQMLAQIPPETITASWDQAKAVIEEAIDDQIFVSLHNARGAVWSAMGTASYHCSELYTLLALFRGRRSYGFRYVEQLLSAEEEELLRETWLRGPDRDEVRRAVRALWEWTRYVWREAERTLGRSLEIQLDEAGLLAAIERIYSLPNENERAPDERHIRFR
jgi:hypothetical protein